MARRIPGASERSVRYRFDRLVLEGVINLSVIVNPWAVGFPVISEVLIRVEPGNIQSVASNLVGLRHVSYVACVLGNHDVGITVYARDNAELYTTVEQQIQTLPGVKETNVILVPRLLKDGQYWWPPSDGDSLPIAPRTPPYFLLEIERQILDQIDLKIIDLLQDDPRTPVTRIARCIDIISPGAVQNRIRSLIQRHVIEVTAIIAPDHVGFPVRADIYIRVKSGRALEVAQQLAALQETSWVACAIGTSDLSIQVRVRDLQMLYHFVTEVLHAIPGIAATSTTLVSEILKDTYHWRIPQASFLGNGLARRPS